METYVSEYQRTASLIIVIWQVESQMGQCNQHQGRSKSPLFGMDTESDSRYDAVKPARMYDQVASA